MSALLEVRGVTKHFPIGGMLSGRQVRAVEDANFSVGDSGAEIFTIIGESGSGKTTLARMILGLERPTSGEILFGGQPVTHPSRRERLAFMAKVQPVFQNPFEAFNPLKRVERYLAATARRFLGLRDRAAIDKAVDESLHKVGLSLAEVRGRFPHELSGGQLQRAAIARALIPGPSLLIADEPVSMVDASLRMAIVNLLRNLRDNFGVTVIYITHDLATAYYISDRLVIMQRGLIVEMGPARPILDDPVHPYSKLLKSSVLAVDAIGSDLAIDPQLLAAGNADAGSTAVPLQPGPDGRLVRAVAI
ncbi:MAG: ABC transporter ATP-binding protein [Devosia sp.]